MPHPLQGENILKRSIEHMCSGPFDTARENALDILNTALETLFMENKDIMHESGNYWVKRQVSTNPAIAPLGSVYYQIFKTGVTCSESTTFVTANLERAIATCERMAVVSSPEYRKVERAMTRAERGIRKGIK